MSDKKNLCAMISADLHAKVIADKEKREIPTLGDYMEMVLTQYFKGGTIMSATKTLAIQLPTDILEKLQAYLKVESERAGRKITQKEFITTLITEALEDVEL